MNRLIFGNEGGYALVLAIILLGILMVAGVLVSNTSVTELGTVRNTIVYAQDVAAAESAAMSVVQILENEPTDSNNLRVETTSWNWLIPAGADENSSTYSSAWGTITAMSSLTSRVQKEGAVLRYRVLGWRPAPGGSLGTYAEMIQESVVKGVYYTPKDGFYTVEMGYRKRF